MNDKVVVIEKDDGNVLEILGKDGILRIAVWLGDRQGSAKLYELFCENCDEKLTGVTSRKVALFKGSVSCYCNPNSRASKCLNKDLSPHKIKKLRDIIGEEKVNKRGNVCKILSEKFIKNRPNVFEVFCPVCSTDKEMFPDGIWISKHRWINSEDIPCGCSERYSSDSRQKYLTISRICSKIGYKFHGFIPEGLSQSEYKLKLTCDKGHYYETTSYANFTRKCVRCPSCSGSGFDKNKDANLYITRWKYNNKSCLKFGITNKPVLERLYNIENKSNFKYEVLNIFKSDGFSILQCEKKIKYSLITCFSSKEDFPDGYTETVEDTLENLEKILKIVEECGLK